MPIFPSYAYPCFKINYHEIKRAFVVVQLTSYENMTILGPTIALHFSVLNMRDHQLFCDCFTSSNLEKSGAYANSTSRQLAAHTLSIVQCQVWTKRNLPENLRLLFYR